MNALEQLKSDLENLYSDAVDSYPDDASMNTGYREGLSDALKALDKVMHPATGKEDIIRVVRVYEFSGPRSTVEKQITNSVHQEKEFGNGCTIKAATLGLYPEILYPQPKEH